ncbi:MAG: GNAT family N-acetyltransferase [Acidobacteria bacterium]|nr:MAG: GNAT family N-acetyltransferase [Acidobacteriota bacterium]
MPSPPITYTTKELSMKTWLDFVRLFSRGSGWDFCQCMHFHRPRSLPKQEWLRTRAERGARNRRQKRALVEQDRAHGILVYANGAPVGWCQYGPCEELPRIDNQRIYRGLAPKGSERLWRITCFTVLKPYRQRGVASAALQAALKAIRRQGGGLVEAYPITRWLSRAFGNESTHGTESMFVKAGFKRVAPFGGTRYSSHVLMRRTVRQAAKSQ